MNLIDFITLGVFAAVFLLCIYRGFTHSLLSFASILLSITFALIFMPIAANAIKSSDKIMPMMLYYTEGSEFIKDSELAKRDVTSFSSTELESIIKNAGLPYPISKCVSKNIARESFAKQDIHTLGDYFNQTMVSVPWRPCSRQSRRHRQDRRSRGFRYRRTRGAYRVRNH